PSTVFPGPGSYVVKLTAISTNGCRDSIEKQVMIDVKPVANFLLKDAEADKICEGNQVIFLNNTVNNMNGTYHWDFDNGVTSTAMDTAFIFGAAGSYDVSLVATTLNGCSDTVTNTVTVNPSPVSTFNFTTAS